VPEPSGLGDDSKIDGPVDKVLHGQRNQQKAHDADEDADAGLAEDPCDTVCAAKDEEAGKRRNRDGAKDGDLGSGHGR